MSDDNIKVHSDEVSEDARARELSDDTARVEKLARTIRHIGYSIFGGLGLLMAVFLLVQALGDIQDGKVYDPFSGAAVESPGDIFRHESTHP